MKSKILVAIGLWWLITPAMPLSAQVPERAANPAPAIDQVPSAQAQISPQQQRSEQNVQALAERVFESIDQLIPGDFNDESPLVEPFKEIAQTFSRGEFEQVETRLAELKSANPGLPPAALLFSGMLFAVEQVELARLKLEECAIAEPEYPGVYLAFARLAIARQHWADAAAQIKELQRTIDAGTWDADQTQHFRSGLLDARAEVALGREQYDDARQSLSALRQLLPENSGVLVRLADLDFRQDNIPSAIDYLNAARVLDSSIFVPELVLFQWYGGAGKRESAQQWIEQAVQAHPDDLEVQFQYSKYLLEHADPTEAAIWLEKAEKNGANSAAVQFVRGQIAFYRGAFQVAEADFKQLSSQRPNDFATKNMLALCLIESSDPARKQNALELASFNVQANRNNIFAASTLGWVLYRQGRFQEAQQIFSQVVNSPNVPTDSAYYVSHLLADEGQYERAVNLLQQALDADGLFLNRVRAEEMIADLKNRMEKTGPPTTPTGDNG